MPAHPNRMSREGKRETIPLCRQEGIIPRPLNPPARGYSTGSRRRENPAVAIRTKTGAIV